MNLNLTFATYQTYPSAFQLIEWPFYLLNGSVNDRNMSLSKLALIILASTVITPIVTPLTSLTIVADLGIGLVEAISAKYRGCSSHEIQLILQKKWIAAPLQQLAFLAITVIGVGIVGFNLGLMAGPSISLQSRALFVILGGSCIGAFSYRTAQSTVGKSFPKWAKPDGFNIFINGGSLNEFGEKLTDEKLESDYRKYQKARNAQSSSQPSPEKKETDPWIEYVDTAMNKYEERSGRTLSEALPTYKDEASKEFGEFLKHFLDKKTPNELLGLQSAYTQEDLLKAYKSWSRKLHPDKNGQSADQTLIAEILFQGLMEARLTLEKKRGF